MTPAPISDDLRARVRAALDDGATISSIARESGVDRAKLSDWLARKRNIRLDTADRIYYAVIRATTI